MQKLYCYVDETGQDTQGKLFLVSVVITDAQRDKLRIKLRKIEKTSKRGIKKWMKSTRKQRLRYIKAIIADKDFKGLISYSKYKDVKTYVDLTILTTAKAILDKAQLSYQANVFVDGLRRSERYRFAAGLRRLKVKVKKVRGIKDQSDEFIRLADSMAGFVRDSLEEDKIIEDLYKKAVLKNIIKEL